VRPEPGGAHVLVVGEDALEPAIEGDGHADGGAVVLDGLRAEIHAPESTPPRVEHAQICVVLLDEQAGQLGDGADAPAQGEERAALSGVLVEEQADVALVAEDAHRVAQALSTCEQVHAEAAAGLEHEGVERGIVQGAEEDAELRHPNRVRQ